MIRPRANYREYAAKGIVESLRKLGICPLVNGVAVHALPTGRIKRYPGMVFMVQRYRPEIIALLDAEVE